MGMDMAVGSITNKKANRAGNMPVCGYEIHVPAYYLLFVTSDRIISAEYMGIPHA